jgi:mannose-6-phosphate isomerase-like protein (cupin superfamily)
MRRVVTGLGPDGRSRVVSDGPAPESVVLERLGGATFETLWQVTTPPDSVSAGGDPTVPQFQFPPGLAGFFRSVIPPDHLVDRSDMNAIFSEIQEKLPDLIPLRDPRRGPGMHAHNTIDFVVVVSGRVRLMLEDGHVDLAAGDAVVQRGTWHAWHNPWQEPCVIAGASIAAGGS